MKASTTRVSLTDGAKLMTETLPNTIVKVVDSLTETGTVVYFEGFNHGLNVDSLNVKCDSSDARQTT